MTLRAFLTASVLNLLFIPFAIAQAQLQQNDVIAITGDSITEQKQYSVFMEDYLLMCRPELKVQATQFGWGGETAIGFFNRVGNDCLVFKPTVATTFFGMNDGGYTKVNA